MGKPATGPTHLLPTGRPGSGLVRLAGPAPTAGPCREPRPFRRGARPATLARCPRAPRQGPGRARHSGARRPSPDCRFPLLGRHGKENGGQRFLGGPEVEERRPARLRLRPPFCTTRQEAARGGGHLRGLRSAAAAPLTFTENSAAAAAAASSGSGRRGRGREGEGERKTKKGEGRGRKESGTA